TAGAADMRACLPNSRIMVHQPSGGYQGQVTDIMIHAQEAMDLKRRLNEIYVKHSGLDIKKVEELLERDRFISPEEGKSLGLIDTIYEKRAVPDGA
ncbi:MAG: ATP-dependent Clp protease proteolytic subunit, partial [Rhizobiaceae bacterium]|nr:ATP-dependent Clp protease proteolytic subunit [Rhizobiaceae bacterium]